MLSEELLRGQKGLIGVLVTAKLFLSLLEVRHHASQLVTLDWIGHLIGIDDLLLINERLLGENCLRLLLKHVLLVDEGIHLI